MHYNLMLFKHLLHLYDNHTGNLSVIFQHLQSEQNADWDKHGNKNAIQIYLKLTERMKN